MLFANGMPLRNSSLCLMRPTMAQIRRSLSDNGLRSIFVVLLYLLSYIYKLNYIFNFARSALVSVADKSFIEFNLVAKHVLVTALYLTCFSLL